MGGEQLGLLCVGAKAAADKQHQPGVAAGGSGHAVERHRHIGTHRLAGAVGQRAAVAAAAGMGRAFEPGRVQGQFGGGPGTHRHLGRPAAARHPQLGPSANRHLHPRGTEAGIRKADRDPVGRHAVAGRAPPGRRPGQRHKPGLRQMPRVGRPVPQHRRFEQPRVVVAHHLRRRHRRQIRRPLMTALGPQRLPKREQHQQPTQQRRHQPQQQKRRLTTLAARPPLQFARQADRLHAPTLPPPHVTAQDPAVTTPRPTTNNLGAPRPPRRACRALDPNAREPYTSLIDGPLR